MSGLPALMDQDFIRLNFAHFEERCHLGGLFIPGSLRCSWQMEQGVLGRRSTKQRPSERLGGHHEHSRSLAHPQRAKQGTAASGKHNSGIQQLLWAPGSLTKSVLT